MNKLWKVNKKPPKKFLEQFPEYSQLTLQLLWDRGLKTQKAIDEFFNPDYDQDLHDPFLMNGMNKAVNRIKKAVNKKEKVVVFGDYDADGVCSVAILTETLRYLGLKSKAYIPDRVGEGYGRQITPKRLAEQKIKLTKTKICYQDFCDRLIPKEKKKKEIEINKDIKWVKLSDLCNIEKKTAHPQNQMELNGNTPYVTTSSKNNGVSNFVNEKPNTKAKCLTVALNGSVAETFFQFDDFITSGDNAVLRLKNDYNPYLLMFIGFMIEKQNWKYNYYQKLSLRKLKNFQIPIPFNKEGKINLRYIESLIKNSFGFDYLKKYF